MEKIETTLSNEGIAQIIDAYQNLLSANGFERKAKIARTLVIEEALLKMQDELPATSPVFCHYGRHFGKLLISVSIPGSPINPFQRDENETSQVMSHLLTIKDIAPVWIYRNGHNIISLSCNRKKSLSPFICLMAALASAIVSALLCRALLSPEHQKTLLENFITPFINTILNVISTVSGPLIFFSVLSGICAMGDMATAGKIGKVILLRLLAFNFLSTIIGFLIILPFFSLTKGTSNVGISNSILSMILDIIPKNAVDPFFTGNAMQIIFLSICVGLGMLTLAEKTATIFTITNQVYLIIGQLMTMVNKIIPFLVFLSIFSLILDGKLGQCANTYKAIILTLSVSMLFLALLLLYITVKTSTNPLLLIKKLLPSFMIALCTASSAATLTEAQNNCEKKLGIDKSIYSFGLPIGYSLTREYSSIYFVALSLAMAEIYHVPMTCPWFITLLCSSIFLAMSMPPVPGGSLACYAVLFGQLNIPQEALAIALALDILLDYPVTALTILHVQLDLIPTARILHKLNLTILHEKKA